MSRRGGRNTRPRHEAFFVSADGADARLQAVGNNQHRVVDEQRRDLLLVGLELCERLPDVGVFIRRIFQFNDAKRQAVDENHHIGTAVDLAFNHGELVHHEPVVIVHVGKINQPDDLRADTAILAAAFDGDAVYQHPVKGAVAGYQRGMLWDGYFTKRFVQCFGWQLGIELPQRGTQAFRQKRLAKTCPFRFGFAGSDDLTVEPGIPQLPEPIQGGVLDDGFGETHVFTECRDSPSAR